MPKSFAVLGFLVIFTITSFCAHSVDVTMQYDLDYEVGGIWSNEKVVTVQNDIDPKIALKIHCWSSDDDLGEHTLNYKQNVIWKFKVNWKRTTKFVCDSSWSSADGGYHSVKFSAYQAKRDWKKHCRNHCNWSLRQDGGYYGGGWPEPDDEIPFQKMFPY
ncbi:hypothetical protein C5167_009729 [Papaver somniferum]|uniref:S-protein homolog n=1 Tax=Papaver somniferum TaxID=3469 RepID=A0A4Y7JY92_PAPSO|nr:S-protein homolog 29-like [Papaver somniferum]RZC66043.1 hypothetical protein C5167_009729 [Papaver somniferum]